VSEKPKAVSGVCVANSKFHTLLGAAEWIMQYPDPGRILQLQINEGASPVRRSAPFSMFPFGLLPRIVPVFSSISFGEETQQ